jgi:hypothetical protein
VTESESTKVLLSSVSVLLFSFNATDKPSSSGKVYLISDSLVSLVCCTKDAMTRSSPPDLSSAVPVPLDPSSFFLIR